MTLYPVGIASAVFFFGLLMLIFFPATIAGSHMSQKDRQGAYGTYALILIFAIGYGIWNRFRTRRTIVASDRYSYTIKVERRSRKGRENGQA